MSLVGGVALGLAAVASWLFWRSTEERLAAPPVPQGDQEIAWLMPATSLPSWDRFLEAVRWLAHDARDGLVLASDPERAHGHRDIPELALQHRDSTERLWIRWYKLTGDYSAEDWLEAFRRRATWPLAIIGGNTSDRAVELVRLLHRWRDDRHAPVLLLTTATADEMELEPGTGLRDLLDGYAGRSFRFCFTNRQMAEALVDFVAARPNCLPTEPYWDAITWRDDPYSQDFANRISDALGARGLGSLRKSVVPYSVGGALLPSERERQVLEEDLIATWAQEGGSPHVLVLPTVERVARRVLIGLHQAAPWASQGLTVVIGDSMSFNVVCRDRRWLWPTELLPIRLLLFAHEDPVRWLGNSPRLYAEVALAVLECASLLSGLVPTRMALAALPVGRQTGSDDLVLWVRMLRAIQHAAWSRLALARASPDRSELGSLRLVANNEQFLARLRAFRDESGQPFFEPSGNRQRGTGEYVICLDPWRRPNRLATWSVLEVWHSQAGEEGRRRWQLRCRWLMHTEW
ncbi:hypothetical protein HRbin36_00760 [bacterium HR36]|nr:hypothetical protein HRbin36_00760 [bacterium HR36]